MQTQHLQIHNSSPARPVPSLHDTYLFDTTAPFPDLGPSLPPTLLGTRKKKK